MIERLRPTPIAATAALCASAVLAFAACSSRSSDSPQLSTVAPVTATAAPCNEEHAIAIVRPSTVRVSTATTAGTGVVVDMGVVLTLDHVVAHAGAVTVSTANGPFQASVRSEDLTNDLALLMVPQLTTPAVKWGDTGGLVAGQPRDEWRAAGRVHRVVLVRAQLVGLEGLHARRRGRGEAGHPARPDDPGFALRV